jgi:hypothetical protein
MKILAIRYTRLSPELTSFYRALGLPLDVQSRTGDWIELGAIEGSLAVHVAESSDRSHAAGSVELAFESDEPLEAVKERLDAAGFTGGVILDESHGRSLRIVDPEGVPLQINEFDRELFT